MVLLLVLSSPYFLVLVLVVGGFLFIFAFNCWSRKIVLGTLSASLAASVLRSSLLVVVMLFILEFFFGQYEVV